MKACCSWMEELIANESGDGFSVVPERIGKHRVMMLCVRSYSKRIAGVLAANVNSIDLARFTGELTPLALQQTVAIAYCPHCGAELKALIETQIDEFDRIASQPKPYD